MRRIAFLYFILIVAGVKSYGQGISNYNLYNINNYAINPAYVGSQNGLFTLLHFKNHLTGVTNLPRNLMFVAHSPIGEKISLGGNITVGQGGVFKYTSASLASSYKVNFSSEHRVTFGLSGGFVKQNLDMDKLSNVDLSDPTLQTSFNDKVFYKFGFGAIYNWKNLEVSLALPNALQEQRDLLSSYFIGYANYKIATANGEWVFRPSVLYKSIPVSKNQLDIYMQAQWKSLLWGLAGYRTNNNLIFGGGVTIENMNLGYAYEAPTGTRYLSKGTHEVVFTFLLKKKTPKLPEIEETNVTNPTPVTDTNYAHIKELEAEVAELKKEIGEISHYISRDSIRHTKDSIYILEKNGLHEKKIQSGNYVVVQYSKTKDFAHKLQKMYSGKGINTFVVYNQTQMVFYIIEKYFPSFDDARFEVDKMRKKGYKNAWVMVY